ncbi:MAG: hypothetical protein IPG61_05440 [bacterium]|nr:hypothetical protein [bacterium]MBK7670194.1 hypothetical protein [bacterium]
MQQFDIDFHARLPPLGFRGAAGQVPRAIPPFKILPIRADENRDLRPALAIMDSGPVSCFLVEARATSGLASDRQSSAGAARG